MNNIPDNIQREITPLTNGDCLLVFDRKKDTFDFPVHFHPEFELTFIEKGKGLKRIVGDHIDLVDDLELVLLGPNIVHAWEQNDCPRREMHEITIQFHRDLFHETFLTRNIMRPIKEMLERSSHGILFSEETIGIVMPRIKNLVKRTGMDSFMELLSLLFDLSNSRNQQLLSTTNLIADDFQNSNKLKKIYDYIHNNYASKIRVEDIANEISMTEVSFSRYIKQRTGKTFIEFLNDFRIGFAIRYLIETNLSIAEVAYQCGFNNLANFNRIFKKTKGLTPTDFRKNFTGIKRVN